MYVSNVFLGVAGFCSPHDIAATTSENIRILDQIRILPIPLKRVLKNIKYSVKPGSQKLMEREILTEDELAAAVAGLDGWTVDGEMLKKKLKFENFAEALEFVNKTGALAESADHH